MKQNLTLINCYSNMRPTRTAAFLIFYSGHLSKINIAKRIWQSDGSDWTYRLRIIYCHTFWIHLKVWLLFKLLICKICHLIDLHIEVKVRVFSQSPDFFVSLFECCLMNLTFPPSVRMPELPFEIFISVMIINLLLLFCVSFPIFGSGVVGERTQNKKKNEKQNAGFHR